MALDGAFLRAIACELRDALVGLKVDKIHQPQNDSIIIAFRGYSGSFRLILCANPQNPRIHITQSQHDNPISAPMFCMLLRKHLMGARLLSIVQSGLDRILTLAFEAHNELGDICSRYLTIEIMGRHSNIIFYDEDRRIIDSIRHVDFTVSSIRQVLPGLLYEAAPAQGKMDLLAVSKEELNTIFSVQNAKSIDKYILETFEGLSPLICREIVFKAFGNTDMRMDQIDIAIRERICFFCARMFEIISENKFVPILLSDPKTKKPKEFSFTSISQYGIAMEERKMESFSALLEEYYDLRDRADRIRQKSQDILKVVVNSIERVSKKLNAQLSELETTKNRNSLKLYGDLIMANLYRIKEGISLIEVENCYDPDLKPIAVPLDQYLTPVQNAQKYYKDYQKAKVKEGWITKQLEHGNNELLYLESVFDELSRAENERDLAEIRDELCDQGYILHSKTLKKRKNIQKSLPHRFISDDGLEILVGKNNHQNDLLTLKTASKNDIWLHTKNIPGSHTIICSNGQKVPDLTITQAACLAALHSKARNSMNVPVDYTLVRNVKKPAGAKPGMVIYENFMTAYVKPDEELIKRLLPKI